MSGSAHAELGSSFSSQPHGLLHRLAVAQEHAGAPHYVTPLLGGQRTERVLDLVPDEAAKWGGDCGLPHLPQQHAPGGSQ